MTLRKANCPCDTEILKLKTAAGFVTEIMAAHANEGPSPNAAHLGRKISALKVNWASFEEGYQKLYGTATADQDIEECKAMFGQQLAFYSEALEKEEALQASLQVTGPAPLTLKERLDDCLLKQTHLFAATENLLTKVFAVLETNVAPPGRTVLQAQVKALEDVKQEMVEDEKLTQWYWTSITQFPNELGSG